MPIYKTDQSPILVVALYNEKVYQNAFSDTRQAITLHDGRRLDSITVTCSMNSQRDVQELIHFLQVHQKCFTK